MLEEQNKKVDIFKDANRDFEMEAVEQQINEITDNGRNPGALFPDNISISSSLLMAAGVTVEKPNPMAQIDLVLDIMGGRLINEDGQDTGYRSPNQKAKIDAQNALKSLLDPQDDISDQVTPQPQEIVQLSAENFTNSAILEEALKWASEGKSVIPVGADKRPLILWKEFHSRIATEAEIRGWWEKYPEAQLGLVTGQLSGIAVVDVEKEFGDYTKLGLPDTTVSRTGSGGYHLFYRYVDGVRNKAKIKDQMGRIQEVDIRGEGGYVVLPPSESTKGKYEWVKIANFLPGFPVEKFPSEKPVANGEGFERKLEYKITEYPGFPAGQRNDEMTRYIGSLVTKLHPDLWDTIAWQMTLAANDKNNPPLNEQEVRRSFDSICQKEVVGDYERWHNKQRETAEAQLKAQLDDIKDDDIVTLTEAADAIRKTNPQTYPTGFAVFDDVMKGGWKEGDLIIVTGMSGHGKTTLGQTFTYNLIQSKLPVLWFSYEVSADILDDKFKSMGVGDAYSVFVPRVVATGEMLWIEKKMEEAIEKHGVRAVFIDLIDFLEPKKKKGSDNETLSLRRIASEIKTIGRKLRLITFVMAHVRKQKDDRKAIELTDIAHSSGIAQNADYVFAIERDPEKAQKGASKTFTNEFGQEVDIRKAISYSETSTIRIIKNRYTGGLVGMNCSLGSDGRFFTSAVSVDKNVPYWNQRDD